MALRLRVLVLTVACSLGAGAAKLSPAGGPKYALPLAGLEINRGQTDKEILFFARGIPAIGISAQSVLYSPLGIRLNFVASHPAPALRLGDPLPGVVNSYTGAAAGLTGITRHAAATLAGVYPGVDARIESPEQGVVQLRLLYHPGVAPAAVQFELTKLYQLELRGDGSLLGRLTFSRYTPTISLAAPVAVQPVPGGWVSRPASFVLQPEHRFSLAVADLNPAAPVEIVLQLLPPPWNFGPSPLVATAADGGAWVAAQVPDPPGKPRPFPQTTYDGCGDQISGAAQCTDIAIYRFSPAGELRSATYLSGHTHESPASLLVARDGAVFLTGATDSPDFPVTPAAIQKTYAGPPAAPRSDFFPSVGGDQFAVRLDPANGQLAAATLLGGPAADFAGHSALGPDGSLHLFPKWLVNASGGMPTTSGALRRTCEGDPCRNGYAARLSPSLDRLVYGTYLPGSSIIGELHSDGSLYFTGWAEEGFPVTPGVVQPRPAGGADGILARLDQQGAGLLFATYLGTPDTDWILRMSVAPDGSVWANVSSFVQCCIDIRYRLVRLDAAGTRLLADLPLAAGDLAAQPDGGVILTGGGDLTVSPNALQAYTCSSPAYLRLDPSGRTLFTTWLPFGVSYDFAGREPGGRPLLKTWNGLAVLREEESAGVFAGCLVDGASFANPDTTSPGAIVTLFGSNLGPGEGVPFRLIEGRLPLELGGVRVLVNGRAAPLLYASHWQINLVLPFDLPLGSRPTIQVVRAGEAGNTLDRVYVQRNGISLFRLDASRLRPAAALNEDGTVNSDANPARPGSRVVLFGTGGGATTPPSIAGEVTPLELRWLADAASVRVWLPHGKEAPIEYAGAAPGLVAGAIQINIRLPDTLPEAEGYPKGRLPLGIQTGSSFYPGSVTIAVR